MTHIDEPLPISLHIQETSVSFENLSVYSCKGLFTSLIVISPFRFKDTGFLEIIEQEVLRNRIRTIDNTQ